MISSYKVITLCGSTRFKDEFLKVQKELTLQGNIVISVGLFGHSGDDEVWGNSDTIDYGYFKSEVPKDTTLFIDLELHGGWMSNTIYIY